MLAPPVYCCWRMISTTMIMLCIPAHPISFFAHMHRSLAVLTPCTLIASALHGFRLGPCE
jgi:hypothetical protein